MTLYILPVLLLGILISFLFVFWGNRTPEKLVSSGRLRRYLLYVPDSYHPDRPAPLVISIHGFVQWPAHQARLSGWNRLADRDGFLVVYPQGRGFPLRWYAGPISEDQPRSEEDLQFFLDLIERLSQSYNIDSKRIYLNGMSNGGGMTNLLACRLPELFAACGGVAGAYLCPGEFRVGSRPVPWIAFHGQEDPIVPYQGGGSGLRHHAVQFPPVEDWCADWAAANGCDPNPIREEISPHITRLSYQPPEGGAEVIFYRIQDGGHTWPGGGWLPGWLTGKINKEIEATALMWAFFQKYRLE